MIRVQHQDFDLTDEYNAFRRGPKCGAIVVFTGLVREFSSSNTKFILEHYPGMTESVLEKLEREALDRWPSITIRLIHRIGELHPNDQIVFVGVSSPHRAEAFLACEFLIDTLKTNAPFWKKEGDHWVEAAVEDESRAKRWAIEPSGPASKKENPLQH